MIELTKPGLCLILAVTATMAAPTEHLPYGVTRNGTILISDVHPSLLDVNSPLTRVLLIGGAASSVEAAKAAADLMDKIADVSGSWMREFSRVSISVIASPYPGGFAARKFPPSGKAYDDLADPEGVYLWRWTGMLAPDVVIEVHSGASISWTAPASDQVNFSFAESLPIQSYTGSEDLSAALANHAVCEVAAIPALSLRAKSEMDLLPLLRVLQKQPVRSPARQELSRRRNRSPIEVAQNLSNTYGQQLNEVAYIPAMALVGRLRLGDLTGDPAHRRDIERIVQPYRSGEKPSLPANSNQSQQAGHLVFGELADITHDPRYIDLLRQPAELGFDADGKMREVMPAHSEMSDAIFLGTPLLAQAARLTGEARYREMALRHLQFMMNLNQRSDGLHQHSPLDPDHTAWGRGNGFVALGLAFTLSELPNSSDEFREVLKYFQNHLTAMLRHQDELGMWHQVIDHPESYREFTVTCMTAFSIARGLRRGWLDRAQFEPAVQRAWLGIKQRSALDGGLVDVCTGTGKMKSLREYLDRPAILGRDDRGGAMALLVSTELAYAEREKKLSLN